MPPVARIPVYGLDLVRLVAALAVLLYHFGFNAFAVGNNQILRLAHGRPQLPQWWEWTWFGWIGVQVFFVISGLVIGYSVDGSSAPDFARKRALRLIPVVWISAIIALPVTIVAFEVGGTTALTQAARTIAFFPIGPWIMGQFWTLPIEVAFYGLVWLLILVRRHAALEALAWVLAGNAAAYLIATRGYGIADPAPRLTALLLLQHGQYFALGILGSRIDQHGYRLRHLVLAGGCVALAAVQIRNVVALDPHLAPLQEHWAVPFLIWLSAMALVWASFHWKRAIAAAAGSMARPIRHVGLITFPIYTLHVHTGGPVLALLRRAGMPPWFAILAGAIVAVAAASLVVLAIEPRVRKMVARLLADPRDVGSRAAVRNI